ncbi:hypothetical protein [Profundibacter sp.]
MKLVKLENVSPIHTVRELMENSNEDINPFIWIETYWGDITLNFSAGPLKFTNAKIYWTARNLMVRSFSLNFHEVDRLQADLIGIAGGTLLTIDVTTDGYNLLFEPLFSETLLFNNTRHELGNPVLLQTSILEFNRICGALYKEALETIDDKLENIDGVEDYFGSIPFSEGFKDSWEDFDYIKPIPSLP